MERNNETNKTITLSTFNYDDITRCPKCNLICLLTLIKDNNKFYINYACENKHEGKIELKEYMNEYRNYSIAKQLCNDCGISQKDKTGEFMYCSNCNTFICFDCFKKHKEHVLYTIDKYDSLCQKHFYLFSSYCNDCKINLCPYCTDEHKNHELIYLTDLKYSNDSKKNLKNDIDSLKKGIDNLNEIISLSEKLKDQINSLINFMNLLLNTYEYKENQKILNFKIFQNLNICGKKFDINKIQYLSFIQETNKYFNFLIKNFDDYIKKDKKENLQEKNSNDNVNQNIGKNKNENQSHKRNDDNNQIFNNNLKPQNENNIKKDDNNNHNQNQKTKEIISDSNKEENQKNKNNIIQSISNQIKNIDGNNQMEKVDKRNEIKYQRNEAYNKNLYSFDCQFQNDGTYELDLSKKIKPEISFKIKNNGNKDWKENETFLKTNKNSQLKINDYQLSALRKGDSKTINLNIPSINKIKDGNYNIILDFCVNNQIYGEPIKIVVKILQEENLLKLIKFRENYCLTKNDFSDEMIINALKKHKFDYEKAFASLFE